MAATLVVDAGTGDVFVNTGATQLHGYCVEETAAAAATVVLRDGLTLSDPPIAFIELPASQNETVLLPGIDIATGILVDRQAGTTRLTLYVS